MEDEPTKVIRVGSRKSELALIQTNFVIDSLKKVNPDKEFTIVTMTTLGDRILNVSLPKIGEKSLFTKDLEDALRNNTVDFVVHSLKDLPTTLPEGLAIGAVFEREDPRDALVLREDLKDHTLSSLPEGSVVGTSSLRRTAQLHSTHPHLVVRDVRGNLNTRLRKLDTAGTRPAETPYAALVLATAGMERMGWQGRISRRLPCAEMLYAVGQGALGVECRATDAATLSLLAPHNHAATYARVLAERSFLRTLGGGCSAPVGVSTTLKQLETEFKLSVSGAVWSLDGKTKIHHKMEQTFQQIKKTAKHRLSPTDETDNKKLKTDDTENPVEKLNRKIDERTLNCEDTRTPEEIEALRSESEIHCGMTTNKSMPIEVVIQCEELGKHLAESLISKGALEVMQVTKDIIRSAVEAKQS